MGRSGDGVEIRESSIRLSFTLDGVRHRHTLMLNGEPIAPTPANVKYAKRLSVEIREKIRLGVFSVAEYFPASGVASPLTVGTQLDEWLKTQDIEGSTKSGYESAIRFWKAAFGDKALRALKLSDILKTVAARPDLTGKTKNNYVSVLNQALALAVDDGLIGENPADKVPRYVHQKEPPDPFTADEREQVIREAHRRYPGQVANLIEFWLWSGLRTSELFALHWDKIGLAAGEVLIDEALVKGERKGTKTNHARTLKLNSRALGAIKAQKAHTFLAGAEVFQDPRYGQAWLDERAFRRSFWSPILKGLDIRYRRPYNCRHTYATTMLMAGMAPAFCARQLGHSVEIFLSTYAKWLNGEQDDREMARLEMSLLNNKKGTGT